MGVDDVMHGLSSFVWTFGGWLENVALEKMCTYFVVSPLCRQKVDISSTHAIITC